MRLTEFLSDSAVKMDLEARDKVTAIEELVDLLVEEHEISMVNRAAVIESVLTREESMSTGMEHGIAIPHGAVDSIDDVVAALGISHAGIDFRSLDGQPAHIIILVLLPSNRYSYGVHALAGISRLLSHPVFRKKLQAVKTPEEAMDIIIEEEESELLA